MLGKTEGRRGRKRMRWLDSITYSMDMSLSELLEIVKSRWSLAQQREEGRTSLLVLKVPFVGL